MRRLWFKRDTTESPMRGLDIERQGVPLTMLLPGERARIVALQHGKGRQHHFRTMGLMEGKIVRVIASQPGRGPLVIDVEGTQIAVGRGMARHILIMKL